MKYIIWNIETIMDIIIELINLKSMFFIVSKIFINKCLVLLLIVLYNL